MWLWQTFASLSIVCSLRPFLIEFQMSKCSPTEESVVCCIPAGLRRWSARLLFPSANKLPGSARCVIYFCCVQREARPIFQHTRSRRWALASRKFQHRKLFNLLHSSLQVGNINHTWPAGRRTAKVKCIHSLNAQLLDAGTEREWNGARLSTPFNQFQECIERNLPPYFVSANCVQALLLELLVHQN